MLLPHLSVHGYMLLHASEHIAQETPVEVVVTHIAEKRIVPYHAYLVVDMHFAERVQQHPVKCLSDVVKAAIPYLGR